MISHRDIKSIRTFIGAKNFEESSEFYKDFGCTEYALGDKMSYFEIGHLGFYLQDYYVKDWVNNSMLFLEVDNVDTYWQELLHSGLDKKYKYVRFGEIKNYDWGKVCFMHDPSGVLWQIGQFNDTPSSAK